MMKYRAIWTGATLVIVGCLAFGGGVANAVAPIVEADVVAGLIDDVASAAVVAPDELSTGDLLATAPGGTVTIPRSPEAAVTLSATDAIADELAKSELPVVVKPVEVSVALPALTDSKDAEVAIDGTVSYGSDDDATVAVQPLEDGARFLSILESSDAPSTFDYSIDLPEGARLIAAAGGGAEAIDSDGHIIATIEAPWALDANGASVATRYEIVGNVITQVVEHADGEYEYPITADPKISFGWWIYVKFTKSETKKLAGYTSYAALTTAICAAITATGIGAICAVVIGAAAIALDKSFNSAAAKGKCVELKFHYAGFNLGGWKQVTC